MQNGEAYVFEFLNAQQGGGNPFRLFLDGNGAQTQLDLGTWAVRKDVDGSENLVLDSRERNQQVRLPISVLRNGNAAPSLLIELNGQRQPFSQDG